MTTTIDFDALQVSEGPRVTLLENREVGGGLVGDDFADFSAFASLSVDVKVQRLSSTSPPPLLTLLVEHSDDGLSWSTAETFTFTDDGERTASLASPKAHVRARASGSGAEWYVKSVNVAPISGGGGGSTPAGSDGQIQYNDGGSALGASPDLVWDHAEKALLLNASANGTALIKANGPGGQVEIIAADGVGANVGGEIGITAGDSDGGDGGAVTISAGSDDGGGNGGNVTVQSGSSTGVDSYDGGDIAIRANPGAPAGNRGGDINVVAGQGTTHGGNVTVQGGASDGNVQVYSGNGNESLQLDNNGLHINATKLGFYGATAAVQPTGVAVTAEAIHAALVALGLITA